MYSFEIMQNEEVLAKVCVDEQNENIGFDWYKDNELNEVLNILIDIPYLLVTTGDRVESSYVEMKEKIALNDKRFFAVLKSQLTQYDFTDPIHYDNKTMEEIL